MKVEDTKKNLKIKKIKKIISPVFFHMQLC